MFYIFILESIGTAEVLLIGLVALIVFGPRKLPEFARMLGKAKNEFRRTTDDFRQTWEREVNFETIGKEDEVKQIALATENSIQRNDATTNEITQPEIKEISQTESQQISAMKDALLPKASEKNSIAKHDWL